MRKIYLYIMAVICLNIASCGFLDESSQDEVRPSTVDDLIQLMLGEGYVMSNDFLSYFDHLTDDVDSNFPAAYDLPGTICFDKYKAIYMWDSKMYDFAKEKGVKNYNHWAYIYQRIMGCNVVLSMIDKVVGGHESRENLRGQALAMRGFYYFMLANIYSMPYTSGDPDEILSVPIITEPQLKDSYPPRATLSAVYKQIIDDLNAAQPLLDEYGKKNIIYKATNKFVPALLSRIYLYMGDWEKSIEYSSKIIDKYPSLQRIANYIEYVDDPYWPGIFPPTISPNYLQNVLAQKSVELIWGYGSSLLGNEYFPSPSAYPPSKPAWCASAELNALYVNDASGAVDCRVEFFSARHLGNPPMGVLFMNKGDKQGGASQGLRTSEMYLNRAEANIMLVIEGKGGDLSQAMSDINTLREARFDTKKGIYTPITITDPQEMLEFCRTERRREFAFEHHRWFDIRRWGILGFSHTIELMAGQKETIVFDNPKKYALPIPQEVLDRNPSIKPNIY